MKKYLYLYKYVKQTEKYDHEFCLKNSHYTTNFCIFWVSPLQIAARLTVHSLEIKNRSKKKKKTPRKVYTNVNLNLIPTQIHFLISISYFITDLNFFIQTKKIIISVHKDIPTHIVLFHNAFAFVTFSSLSDLQCK